MSRILSLNPPFQGLSTIVNVLKCVGPGEVNEAADVRVVQRLIQIAGRTSPAEVKIFLPSVTGRFDAATGFWIFYVQRMLKGIHPLQIIDGVVSPARGACYASNTSWAIVLLNLSARDRNPSEYSAFVSSGGVK